MKNSLDAFTQWYAAAGSSKFACVCKEREILLMRMAFYGGQDRQIKRDATLCTDQLPDRSSDPSDRYLLGLDMGVESCHRAILNQARLK